MQNETPTEKTSTKAYELSDSSVPMVFFDNSPRPKVADAFDYISLSRIEVLTGSIILHFANVKITLALDREDQTKASLSKIRAFRKALQMHQVTEVHVADFIKSITFEMRADELAAVNLPPEPKDEGNPNNAEQPE